MSLSARISTRRSYAPKIRRTVGMNLKTVLKILVSRFNEQEIDFVLSGGLALATMNVFRFTKDIDFLIHQESQNAVHTIMTNLDYELQEFSSSEILSYWHPLKIFGQVDFLLVKRKYTKAMMHRASVQKIFDGEFEVKTILPEDLIGLKIQAISNDPANRLPVDASDIQNILHFNKRSLDMELVREYFKIFNKEHLLDDWLNPNH
ncbi:MAG: nucleotidyl transferase AbiEii/AbiGii toxin family protein [Promethearchaeota archaeon]